MSGGISATTVMTAMSVAMAAAGTAMSVMRAQQQAQAADAAQAMARQQAQVAQDRANADVGDMRVENRRAIGGIRAASGASGLLVEEGSGLEATLDAAHAGELNIQRRYWQGSMEAANIIAEGGMASTKGRSDAMGSYATAGSTLLGSASKVKDLLSGIKIGGGYSLDADAARTAGDRDLGGYN